MDGVTQYRTSCSKEQKRGEVCRPGVWAGSLADKAEKGRGEQIKQSGVRVEKCSHI